MTTALLSNFGQAHFGAAQLGDRRRTRSLVELANRFAAHPGDSLPHKCKDPNALRRCYDLMNTPAVTHARVLTPHVSHTLRRVHQHPGVVLILHDGTELDYSGHTAVQEQLGQLGNGHGHGYICHNSLAVLPDAQRTVLGLLQQTLHVRGNVPKGETPTQRRDREDRESRLWLTAVNHIEAATQTCRHQRDWPESAKGLELVDVCDRGGDTFEFLDAEALADWSYVIRSQHDRRCLVGHRGEKPAVLLHGYLRTLPQRGWRTITVGARDGRSARQATVSLAWAAVRVLPPEGKRGLYRQQPLPVWVLRVWEKEPPASVEAVEWFLLVNRPVTAAGVAWEKVDWYTCRWVVEEFHKAQKTGVGIETPQFTTTAALQPMIALLSVVALVLLDLRTRSREPATAARPAVEIVDAEYVEVLSSHRYGERRPLTVREFYQALARLGGHQNRRGDGEPGWLVLWRGWGTLQLLLAGARAARRLDAQPPVKPTESGAPHGRSRCKNSG